MRNIKNRRCRVWSSFTAVGLMAAVIATACGTQTETIEVVKEVVKQVEVPVESI